jgi:hypothetical protein
MATIAARATLLRLEAERERHWTTLFRTPVGTPGLVDLLDDIQALGLVIARKRREVAELEGVGWLEAV